MSGGPTASAANLEPLGKRRIFGGQVNSNQACEPAPQVPKSRDDNCDAPTVLSASKNVFKSNTTSNSTSEVGSGSIASDHSPIQLASPPSTTRSVTAEAGGDDGMRLAVILESAASRGVPVSEAPSSPGAHLKASTRARALAQEWQAKFKGLLNRSKSPDTQPGLCQDAQKAHAPSDQLKSPHPDQPQLPVNTKERDGLDTTNNHDLGEEQHKYSPRNAHSSSVHPARNVCSSAGPPLSPNDTKQSTAQSTTSQRKLDDEQPVSSKSGTQDVSNCSGSQQSPIDEGELKIRGIAKANNVAQGFSYKRPYDHVHKVHKIGSIENHTDEPSAKRSRKNGKGPQASDANLEPLGKRRRAFSPKSGIDNINSPLASKPDHFSGAVLRNAKSLAQAVEDRSGQRRGQRITNNSERPCLHSPINRKGSNYEHNYQHPPSGNRNSHSSSGQEKVNSINERKDSARRGEHGHSSTSYHMRGERHSNKVYRDVRNQESLRIHRHHSSDRHRADAFGRCIVANPPQKYPQHASDVGQNRRPDLYNIQGVSNGREERHYSKRNNSRNRHHSSDVRGDRHSRVDDHHRERSPAGRYRSHRDRSASPKKSHYEDYGARDYRRDYGEERRPRDDYARRYDSQVYRSRGSHQAYTEYGKPARRDHYDADRGRRCGSPYERRHYEDHSGYDGYTRDRHAEKHRESNYDTHRNRRH